MTYVRELPMMELDEILSGHVFLQYQCLVEACGECFKDTKSRKDHLVKVHRYPSNFRWDRPPPNNNTKKTTKKVPHSLAQEQLEMDLEGQGEPIGSTSPRSEQQTSAHIRVKSPPNVRPQNTEGEY